MAVRAAALLALALLVAATGCGREDDAGPPDTCSASVRAIERALERAPSAVVLDGGARLSDCVSQARSNAQLQSTGAVLTRTADRLAERAERGDARAAMRLGYLMGAARRGAARTPGLQAQLQRRVESAATYVGDAGPRVRAALARGMSAGEATG
jgi:hypothetical protein